MSDLHYLTAGAGDIAQLDYFARFFDAFVDNQTVTAGAWPQLSSGKQSGEFYDAAENQLKNMKQLHQNAERHLSPLIEGAIGKER